MRMRWRAVRQIVRGLRRSPGFSLAVVLTVAFVIAANASVFTILNAVLLRPLPYPEPEELLYIGLGSGGIANLPVPLPYHREWLASNRTLTASAMYHQTRATVEGATDPEEVMGAGASASLARVFAVQPARGRFLIEEDERPGAEPVVVLSHDLWVRRFAADSLIVGRSIRMSERSMVVVGVMPTRFDFPNGAAFWRPLAQPTPNETDYYPVVARSRPGFDADGVQRDLAGIPRPAVADVPPTIVDATVDVLRLQDHLFGSVRGWLQMLLVAALMLLVIGCAGVANLVLARTVWKGPELSLRLALGAGRSALVGSILAECILLAAVGGAAGLILSTWITRLFVRIGPRLLGEAPDLGTDLRVLLFVVLLTCAAGALTAAVAAMRATRENALALLSGTGRGGRAGQDFGLLRRSLVTAQIAIAMLLLSGSGLLIKSFLRATNTPLGFEPDQVLIASLQLPRSRYPTEASARQFFDVLDAGLRALPGVGEVAYGTPPLGGFERMVTAPATGDLPTYSVATDAVGPRYFETHGIPIIQGRGIDASDREGAPPVVVINRSAALTIFGDKPPLGQVISALTIANQHPVVIGVAADVPQHEVTLRPLPQVYAALSQMDGRPREIAVRSTGSVEGLADPLRSVLRQLDPSLAVRTTVLKDIVRESTAPRRFTSALAGTFAGLALIVAIVGLFGLMSYLTARRTREIGIRIALGARRGDVIRLTLREGLVLTGAGIGIGLILAIAVSHLLTAFLLDVQPRDPSILFASASLLTSIAVVAILTPALRAARMNPLDALRQE